jgi:hypothetical protein
LDSDAIGSTLDLCGDAFGEAGSGWTVQGRLGSSPFGFLHSIYAGRLGKSSEDCDPRRLGSGVNPGKLAKGGKRAPSRRPGSLDRLDGKLGR